MRIKNYFLSVLSLAFISNFYSQKEYIDYERDTKWNFGINIGATWTEQELDFVNKPGFSGGFTLGRAIYEQKGGLLSFDLRGRLLWGQTKSWSPSPFYDSVLFSNGAGYGYRNYRLEYTEGALELVVNAHKLREQTGVLLYAFGGVGWVSHAIWHNYKNGDVFYNYSLIDSVSSKDLIVNTLSSDFNDKSWETDNEFFTGRRTLVMPSLGLGLGYQISPQFSVGIEHKVTFGFTDRLDGFLDGKNDRLHYTNFNLRWNLFRGGSSQPYKPEQRPVNSNANNYSYPNTEVPPGNMPLVNITVPSSGGTTIYSPYYAISANVYYVSGVNDLEFKHNGRVVKGFVFLPSENVLKSNVVLVAGLNTFVVTATNTEGTDSDSTTIYYNPVCDKPTITFSNPLTNGNSLSSSSAVIEAKILNVLSKDLITLRINGSINNQFTFNPNTGLLVANVECISGNNSFYIEVKNDCGVAYDTRTVFYNKSMENSSPPIVTITAPTVSPYTATNSQESIKAVILNIDNASKIEYKVNGVISNAFSYNLNSKVFDAIVNLQNGSNFIEIKARNNYGEDLKTTLILRKQETLVPLPVVTISFPSVSPFSVSTNTSMINGFVYNISSINDIKVFINGVLTNNYSYNQNTKQIELRANLNLGSNTIKITATNSRGSDSKSTIITYKKEIVQSLPVVSFVYPSTSPFSSQTSTITLQAKVLNVVSANEIQVLQNGNSTRSFNYNTGTKELRLNASLVTGNNTFLITGTNPSGSDQKTTVVVYKKQIVVPAPVVRILSPRTNPFMTNNGNTTLTARVDNVDNQSQIAVTFNGVNTTDFTYDSNTKSVIFATVLMVGSNNIVVSASNSSGSDSQSQVVIRESPCSVPLVGFKIPLESPHNHVGRDGNMAFTFTTENILSSNQVTVQNNGLSIPSNLEQSNGNIWGTVPLVVGSNSLTVAVKNECGEAAIKLDVFYKGSASKLDPPIITIQNPSSFPYTTHNSNVTVLGKVENVSSQTNIEITINGNNSPFTYNTATKVLVIPTSLSIGSHQVKVKATNNYGSDLEVFDLIRTGQPPVVEYTNLGNNNSSRNPMVSPQPNFVVQGRVLNFQGVSFNAYIDGSRISSYTFNSRTGVFSIPVNFSVQGQGTQRKREVEVKVSNDAGSAEKKGNLIYVVQNIAPSAGGTVNNKVTNPLYESNIKQADNLFKQGNYDQAKVYYEKAAKADPKNSYPNQKLSEVTKQLNAIEKRKKAVITEPVKPNVVAPKEEIKTIAKPSTFEKKVKELEAKPFTKP